MADYIVNPCQWAEDDTGKRYQQGQKIPAGVVITACSDPALASKLIPKQPGIPKKTGPKPKEGDK